MKVKMYVNWGEEEIRSEKEFQDRVNEAVEDTMEDEVAFSRICEREFSAFELFCMDSKNKDDIEEIKSVIRAHIKDDFFEEGWEDIEIEI